MMPNYVTSTCSVFGPAIEVERFRREVISVAPAGHSDAGGPLFNFDAIIPMPASLEGVEESSLAEIGAKMILYRAERGAPFADHADWHSKKIRQELGLLSQPVNEVVEAYLAKNPEVEAMGTARLRAVLDTGYASWYPWAIAKWGTKWGAFRFAVTNEKPFAFRFETAWSFPRPIFEKLASLYPALAFDCATYDEGGNFAGEGWFNPPVQGRPFAICDANDELYERVYGRPAPSDEDVDDLDAA